MRTKRGMGRVRDMILVLRTLLLFAWLPGWVHGAVATAPITRIAGIRNLTREEAAKALPVQITGVVVLQGRGGKGDLCDCIVSDGEYGVWVGGEAVGDQEIWQGWGIAKTDLVPGAKVEVEGVTDPGGFAPVILPSHIRRIGTAPVPLASHAPMERLLAGGEDGRLIVLDGVLQSIVTYEERENVFLMVDGRPCLAIAPLASNLDPQKLVDARVRITGVCTPPYNYRSEAIGLQMHIQGASAIEVLKPALADPFQAPKIPLSRLFQFSPVGVDNHRRVTEGTVVFSVPGSFFFLQNGPVSVRVSSNDMSVKTGQRIEVAGFVDRTAGFAALRNAIIRPLGTVSVPVPQEVTAVQILKPIHREKWGVTKWEHDFSGRLVRVKGYLRHVDWKAPQAPELIRLESDGYPFLVNLPVSSHISPDQMKTWNEGAEMELSGICELEFKGGGPDLFHPSGFHLWLASPQDILVLQQPPWWTAQRLWLALGSVAALLAIFLFWNFSLRAILHRRTRRLEEVMSAHRDSELEFQAAKHERQRLAGDLHDGLQQLLVGAAYRLEAASAHLGEVSPAVHDQFQAARSALLRTQDGLRDCLWGLNHVEEDTDDFASLLRHAVVSLDCWSPLAVEVETSGASFPLSRHVMGTLLLLMQEAVGNAFKHGRAMHVTISLHYGSQDLGMVIQDDGMGFDTNRVGGPHQGHFGLESMANRMGWLGGKVDITSKPGVGTRVVCHLPKSRVQVSADSIP